MSKLVQARDIRKGDEVPGAVQGLRRKVLDAKRIGDRIELRFDNGWSRMAPETPVMRLGDRS